MNPIVAFYAGVVGGFILALFFAPGYFGAKPKRTRKPSKKGGSNAE